MNREIKFRGKRLDNGEWVYGSLIQKFSKPHKVYIPFGYWIYVNENECYKVAPETIGQYTGLKDRNGKEIYEGDILTQDNKVFYKVFYGNGSFRVKARSDALLNSDRAQRLEVIGNIYENPELLEGS